MNNYATTLEGARNREGFRNTAFHSVDSTYENYSIKKQEDSVDPTYENLSLKKDDKVTEEKAKVESANQTNSKKVVQWILVFVSFAAFATCCSLIGKILIDFNQEKLNHEESLNNVQSELMEYISHLNQTIEYQSKIIDNQNILIQNNTEVVNSYNDIVNNQSEVINNYTEVINNLQNQQSEVDENLQRLNEMTNNTNENLINGFVILNDDWIAPLNGYQYKLVRSSRSWASARSYCQSNYGADLASLGVQSIKIRRTLRQEIGYTGYYIWIGLNDMSSEGTWRWIIPSSSSFLGYDGDYATNDISLWHQYPPSSYSSSYDCAALYHSNAYAYPRSCSSSYYFLCEKQYN